MTDAQIRYHQMVEATRHNRVQEELARYDTDTKAQMQKYVSDQNVQASKYASDQSAATQRYVSEQNVATQRYAADQSAATQRYATDVNAATQAAKLALDQKTQVFRNSLEAKKVNLERLRTDVQNENTRAQTQKIFQDMAVSLDQLRLQADELGMKQEAAKYTNALNKARKYETDAKTVGTWLKNASDAVGFVKGLLSDLVPKKETYKSPYDQYYKRR